MRIKLIYPPTFYNLSHLFPPASLPNLTAVLRQNGHYVDQDDLAIKIKRFIKLNVKLCFYISKNRKALIDVLLGKKEDKYLDRAVQKILGLTNYKDFDLIGFSALSGFQFLFALLLAKKIKEETVIPVVIGGYHTRWLTPDVYQKFAFVDYIVRGEGELALLKLVEHLEGKTKIKNIPGLWYIKNGKVYCNKPKNLPIEKLPLPDFDGLPLSLYPLFKKGESIVLPYQTALGCPYNCSFCENHKYEQKPIKKVLNELEMLSKKYDVKHFEIIDHTINADYRYLESLCNGLIKKRLDIKWLAYARADNFDKSLLSKMKSAGCTCLIFGIESGSNRLLKFIRKGITAEQASKILKLSYEEGIDNWLFLIAGLPSETKKDLESTVKFIKENAVYIHGIILSVFYINDNSLIKKNPAGYNIKSIKHDINLPHFEPYHLQYDTIQQEISPGLSYQTIFLANLKYILRKKYPILRLIPLFIWRPFLKIKNSTTLKHVC